MKITCALPDFDFSTIESDLNVALYGHVNDPRYGSAGLAVKKEIVRKKLVPAPRAWDLLTLALAVVSADLAGHRKRSPDGWTREFDLTVSVTDSRFWNDHATTVEKLLQFLTTDCWRVQFIDGGILPRPDSNPIYPDEDSVALLSGGLDSYVGVLDLVSAGKKLFVVSQTVRGDAEKQSSFAAEIGGGLLTPSFHKYLTGTCQQFECLIVQ